MKKRLSELAKLPAPLALLSALTLFSQLSAAPSTADLPTLVGTEIATLESSAIDDTFYLYVRLPPEAKTQPDRKFPVVYSLDGDHTFPMMASAATQIGWSGSMPPAIVVGLGWGTLDLENGNERGRDLSPQPIDHQPKSGGGPEFLKFLTTEAFPYVEANYPADPNQRYLYGHSLGGLFALYAYSKNGDAFAGVIAGSPFLAGQLDFLSETAADHPRRTCKLVVITGDQEDATYFIDDLKPLRAKLEGGWAAPGSFEMTLLPGFDHFTMVAPSISMGLKAVFAQ